MAMMATTMGMMTASLLRMPPQPLMPPLPPLNPHPPKLLALLGPPLLRMLLPQMPNQHLLRPLV
jgi:hypothetical protein